MTRKDSLKASLNRWASVAKPASSLGSGGHTASSSSHETFRAVGTRITGRKKPGAAPSGRSMPHPEGSQHLRRGTRCSSNHAHCARDAMLFNCTPNPLLMRYAPLPGAVTRQSNSWRDSDFCATHCAPLLAVGQNTSSRIPSQNVNSILRKGARPARTQSAGLLDPREPARDSIARPKPLLFALFWRSTRRGLL